MIRKCALAVVTQKGGNVVLPSVVPLDDDERSYLQRHLDELRDYANSDTRTRGRFRPGSTLEHDFTSALAADDATFTDIAGRLVAALAAAMKGTANASSCVVALLCHGGAQADTCTLLKLDADIEGARLRQEQGVIRLSVYQDILPRPGKLQKGMSWPDPRGDSAIILRDAGSDTAMYFLNAFGVDGSPSPTHTERALVRELAALPLTERTAARKVAARGGSGESVVEEIRRQVPGFTPTARELGVDGALAGRVRPQRVDMAYVTFESDGIKLQVRLDRLDRLRTAPEGPSYVTTIRTDTPLTDIDNHPGDDATPGG